MQAIVFLLNSLFDIYLMIMYRTLSGKRINNTV